MRHLFSDVTYSSNDSSLGCSDDPLVVPVADNECANFHPVTVNGNTVQQAVHGLNAPMTQICQFETGITDPIGSSNVSWQDKFSPLFAATPLGLLDYAWWDILVIVQNNGDSADMRILYRQANITEWPVDFTVHIPHAVDIDAIAISGAIPPLAADDAANHILRVDDMSVYTR